MIRRLSFLAILVVIMPGCYVTSQAWHHNNLVNSRRPVAEVLSEPATPASTKARLLEVLQILKFAQAEGLNVEGAYRYYIETPEPVVSYLVQAAQVDRLEPVTWWFPFVGRVPYLGYFKQEDRDRKARELSEEGFEIYKSGAGAFSSLGWFEDPIFSSMLRRSYADLAHLFFHELTHRTLWIQGSTEFNENFAEYVAVSLTTQHLTALKKDHELKIYQEKRQDRQLFAKWLKDLRADLQELYSSPLQHQKAALLEKKAAIFAEYQKSPKKPNFKAADYVEGTLWNNAAVLASSLYAPDTERFAKAHACLGHATVAIFIETFKSSLETADTPFHALDNLCRSGGHT